MAADYLNTSSVPLFIQKINTLPPDFSQLLTQYSSIPPADQLQHVLKLRDRAYAHHPYPCLGRLRFLDLDLSTYPLYRPVVLPLLSNREKETRPVYLDLGCCLAQDVRKLIFDLAPDAASEAVAPTNIYGADLQPEFVDIGYELFMDEEKLPREQFLTPADVFDTQPGNTLSKLDGKVGILHCTAVFHLFDGEEQKRLARRVLRLLEKKKGVDLASLPKDEDGDGGKQGWRRPPADTEKCALVLGSQSGNEKAGHYARANGKMRWRHNAKSWEELWNEVVKEDEWKDVVERVEVQSELLGMQDRWDRLWQVAGAMTEEDSAEVRSKVIGRLEEGFRWHVFAVWVVFK